jgi:hypothetical protein
MLDMASLSVGLFDMIARRTIGEADTLVLPLNDGKNDSEPDEGKDRQYGNGVKPKLTAE